MRNCSKKRLLLYLIKVSSNASFVQFRFQQEGVVPFFGTDTLVFCFHAVFNQSAVEERDITGGEATICVDGEEDEGNAIISEAAEACIRAAAGEGFQVKRCPHIDDTDVGVGIEAFGKLGALVQHVAFRAARRSIPSEKSLAIRGAAFAGSLLQASLVDEMLVADNAGQRYAAQGRVVERVAAFAVFFIHFDGAELLKAAQLMLDGRFVVCTDNDDAAHALRVQIRKCQRKHAAYAGAHQRKTIDTEMVEQLYLRPGLVVGIDHREAAAPGLAIGCYAGRSAGAIAAAQEINADDEILVCIQGLARANHAVPPAFMVFRLPEAAGLGYIIIEPVGMVAAGQGMKEQNGITLIRSQGPISLVGKLHVRQGFAVVKGETADRENLCANGVLHICCGGAENEKRTGVCTHRSPFSTCGCAAGGLLNTLLAQARAGSRALTSLELGVALADDVERTLTLHDLAISVAALHGGE